MVLIQSKEWGSFQQNAPGRDAHYLATRGGHLLVVSQALPFNLCWLSIARGPVFDEGVDQGKVWGDLWEKIRALAKKERVVFVRFEGSEDFDVEGKGWRKAHAHYQPEWTLRVNLEGAEEDILAQMKQKGRYNIKVARKKGVTVRATHDDSDVTAFYNILKGTGGRDGFSIHPESYYQTMIKMGHESGWGSLFVAEHEGQIIGGLIATFYGNVATYYYGASDHSKRSLMAPYLTQWTAIQEAKNRGCTWYDFLGVAPPDSPKHPWAGITQFKERFGGERVQYPHAKEFVFKPGWYALVRLRKWLRR